MSNSSQNLQQPSEASLSASDYVKMRVEQIRDASARSRGILATTTLLSLALFVAIFNTWLSWLLIYFRQTGPILHAGYSSPHPSMPPEMKEAVVEVFKDQIGSWVGSQSIQIPFLGLKIASSDIAILGPVSVLLLMIWVLFSVRKENHLIFDLLCEARNFHDYWICRYIASGIGGSQLFLTYTGSLNVYKEVTDTPPEPPSGSSDITSRYTRGVFYIPLWVLIFAFAMHFLTTYILPSPYRIDKTPLFFTALLDTNRHDYLAAFYIVVRTVIGLLSCIVQWLLTCRCVTYQFATQDLIRHGVNTLRTNCVGIGMAVNGSTGVVQESLPLDEIHPSAASGTRELSR